MHRDARVYVASAEHRGVHRAQTVRGRLALMLSGLRPLNAEKPVPVSVTSLHGLHLCARMLRQYKCS